MARAEALGLGAALGDMLRHSEFRLHGFGPREPTLAYYGNQIRSNSARGSKVPASRSNRTAVGPEGCSPRRS